MMTMQARESLAPIRQPGSPLRTYPVDSPRAKARLLVLTLLADGRLDAAELDSLAKYQAFAELGLSREDFFQVLYDFCADAAGLPEGSGTYLMSAADLDRLFAEVCGAAERHRLLRLMFDVIRSDGHLAESEARLFWRALDTWRLRLDDGIEYRPRAAAFSLRRQQRRTAFNPPASYPLRQACARPRSAADPRPLPVPHSESAFDSSWEAVMPEVAVSRPAK